MRRWSVVLFLVLLIVVSFLIWGDWFSAIFSEENAVAELSEYGRLAWLIGIVLLIGDLFLPLPATIIMSALGYIYGPLLGGVLATSGNFLSGMLAYGLCRALGRKGASWILGAEGLTKGEVQFANRGGWIVAISRWLPIVPEVVACMAGLHQMKANKFMVALLCGSLPLGFVFAYVGHTGHAAPYAALVASAVLPAVLWLAAQYMLRRYMRNK